MGKIKPLITLFILVFLLPVQSYASGNTPTYVSPHYKVQQVFFGTGGSDSETSTNFKARVSIGETGVGNYSSSNYQAYVGFNTTADPYLQAVVTSTNLNLGILSTGTTATGTAQFFVRAWDSDGYVVQTDAPAPTNSSYHMATNATPTSPTPGTEQFGMNLVADTTPASLITDSPASANPVQTTTYCCTISFGAPTSNYGTANKFAYTNGDTIAQSTKSTSSTIYTASYIFNIGQSTPGGTYVFNQSIVVTGTY